jgi:hypothetical protein
MALQPLRDISIEKGRFRRELPPKAGRLIRLGVPGCEAILRAFPGIAMGYMRWPALLLVFPLRKACTLCFGEQ